MSFDDLYNNFKIVEQEVKGTASSSSISQNMAFVSSPSSTNEVNTAYGVSTANTQVSPASTQFSTASTQDLEQIHKDKLKEMDLKWQLALLSMRTRRFFQKTGKKITINRSDTAGYDKSKVECFNCHKLGHFARECRGPRNQDSRNKNQDNFRRTVNVEETSSKAMVAIDGTGSQITDKSRKGVGFVSYNAVPPPLTGLFSPLKFDLSNSGLEEFQQPEFEGYGPKPSKSFSEDTSNEVRESPDAPLVEELVSDDKLEKKTVFPTVAKIEFVRPKQQEKPVRKPAHCNYHQRERVVSGNNYTRVNYNYFAKKTHPSAHRNMVPRAVLMKTGLRSLNTARPVNTAHPKTTVYSARPMSHFSKSAQSTVKRPYQIRTTLTNKNFSQKVNTAKGKFYTARQKAVNTARPNSAVVNAVRANQVNAVKASACWVWRPTKLNSASITLKRHNYVDARGISKSVMAWNSRNLMDDMLPLEEEPKKGKLLVKELLKLLLQNASNDEPQPSSDAGKKDDEGVNKESGIDDRERPENNVDMSNITTIYLVPSTPNTRIHKDHSLDHVIGDVQSSVLTRRMTKTTNEQGFIRAVYEGKTHEDLHTCLFAYFLSQEEPKKVWTLVDLPLGKRAIGTKWVYRKKKDERGIVIRNKARLVAQGYTQEEGIDYDEVFAPVARIEAIRLVLACASFKDFVVYQMDVKSAFLYGKIKEDINVYNPPGLKIHSSLTKFLRSMIGSLMYLTSSRPDIMFDVSACARFQVIPKVSHLHAVKRIFRYLKCQPKFGLWYPKDSPFDLEAYTDSDYTGASLDKKSITGGCQFLRSRLISWQCKKQTMVANSTTKAEYIIHKGWLKWDATTAEDGIEVKTSNSKVNAAGHYLVLLGTT
ncbi:ribonuclease H-like domain-containing protein [Tanacetum coccineum]